MSKDQLKIAGIVSLVVCAICVFVAIERYQANAGNVQAMNAMRRSAPFGMGGMMGGKMTPATPAATKYALAFALISGVAGAVCLVKSKESPAEPQRPAGAARPDDSSEGQ